MNNKLFKGAVLAAAIFGIVSAQTGLMITTQSPLPPAVINLGYSTPLVATGGGECCYTWTNLTAMPPGLFVDSGGAVMGTPTQLGTSTFTIQVNSGGVNVSRAFQLTVYNPVVVTPATLPNATRGSAYSATLAATGGGGAPYSWQLVESSLPPGLTLNPATGQITGTPTVASVYSFAAAATDAVGITSAAHDFSLRVNEPTLAISPPLTLESGVINRAYTNNLTATGGNGNYSWGLQVGGTGLPSGITLSSGGSVSGTPTVTGTFTFRARVQDSSTFQPQSQTADFTLTINSTLTPITPASLPPGERLFPYPNTQIGATGGQLPYAVSIASGSLPPGLTMTPTGLISGIPTQQGTFPFSVLLSDGATGQGAQSRTANYSIVITELPLTITTPDPIRVMTGTPLSLNFTTIGGTAPFTYSVTQGALPPGFTLSPAGLLSGTSNSVGSSSFQLSVVDAGGLRGRRQYSFFVDAISITTPSPLPNANQNVAYSQTFQATGGTAPYSFALLSGLLPSGLSLASGGVLSGTPSQSGQFTFVVGALDSINRPTSKEFRLRVNAPQPLILTENLSDAGLGMPYDQPIDVVDGLAPFTWQLTSGSLPPGLVLSPTTGRVQGTATALGPFTFGVRVTGANNLSDSSTISMDVVVAPLAITTTSPLPNAARFAPYSQQLAAVGGVPPYTWNVEPGGPALPPGLVLSSGGLLNGTPTALGTFTFRVQARHTSSNDETATAELTIVVDDSVPVITTPSLPAAEQGVLYSMQLAASGGAPPYTFALTSGSLPSGFQLSATGEIRGITPNTTPGSFTVRVSDRFQRSTTRSFLLPVVTRTVSPVEIVTSALPEGLVGRVYGLILAARFGEPGYSWGISGLPPGLTGNSNGEIIGTPTRPGTYPVEILVTDSGRGRATVTLSLVIRPGLVTITPERLPDGRVDEVFSASFSAAGGTSPYGFGSAGGTLPPGLSLTPGGQLTGTPTQPGTFVFTLQARDAAGVTGSREYAVLIQPARLNVTTAQLVDGVINVPYSAGLAASGGRPPYQWSATGLPDGLALDPATGVITGTPTRIANFPVSVQVSSADGQSATRSLGITISGAVTIITSAVGNFVLGAPASGSLAASGGVPPYSWSVTGGALPAGVGLSSAGAFTGGATAMSPYTFTAQVRDQLGATATRTFSGSVVTPLSITTPSVGNGAVGVPYTASVGATGGTAPYQFSATGNLPEGVSVSADGNITGTPTTAGTFSFTITSRDSATPPQTADRGYTITIGAPQITSIDISVPANPQPQQQPSITVNIGQPFPSDINGTLTLTFAPNAANNADDPMIRFATGTRSVNFTIPAGQTRAQFPGPEVGVQTGTTAGTITITTVLRAGTTPVTCNCDLNRTIVIPRTAPVITNVRLVRTGNSFTVAVTGYSTSREVTQGVFRFGGTNLQTSEVTVPLTPPFTSWFQGTPSQQFGGQFTLALPFTIQGDATSVTSVTVTLTNSAGTSQPSTANF